MGSQPHRSPPKNHEAQVRFQSCSSRFTDQHEELGVRPGVKHSRPIAEIDAPACQCLPPDVWIKVSVNYLGKAQQHVSKEGRVFYNTRVSCADKEKEANAIRKWGKCLLRTVHANYSTLHPHTFSTPTSPHPQVPPTKLRPPSRNFSSAGTGPSGPIPPIVTSVLDSSRT